MSQAQEIKINLKCTGYLVGKIVGNSETYSLLEGVFGEGNIIKEWGVANESKDALQRGLQYWPRIDFAIKPLNINRDFDENRHLIAEAYNKFHGFFRDIKKIGLSNHDWDINRNPRCFLAIEYEDKTTTKHRLGSLINACAIGQIGIVVAVNDKTYRSYERIVRYLEFLHIHGKLPIHPGNYLILKRDDFEDFLKNHQAYIKT